MSDDNVNKVVGVFLGIAAAVVYVLVNCIKSRTLKKEREKKEREKKEREERWEKEERRLRTEVLFTECLCEFEKDLIEVWLKANVVCETCRKPVNCLYNWNNQFKFIK